MFKVIKNAWSIPDLRKKILFTLLIIIVFRIGSVIPVPFLDANVLAEVMKPATDMTDAGSNMIAYLNTLSGGAFSNATLFAMGITPYINSSIIIQLLCVAIPALERLSKEGEAGRRKNGTITRYTTVALGLIQGTAYFFYLKNTICQTGDYVGKNITVYNEGFSMVFAGIVIVLVFTAGTALMMWLGEQINKNGIGNGISILLFAGIVARFPATINDLISIWKLGAGDGTAGSAQPKYFAFVIVWVVMFLAIIWLITYMQDSERRIPIQYAKRVVGRKMYGGQSSHLPIKVALGGVLPIIFASSILSIPSTVNLFLNIKDGFWGAFWMMCGRVGKVDGSAVSGAEIDIIESGECPRRGVNHAIHWDGYGEAHKAATKVIPSVPELYEGWHTYGFEWTKEEYVFYIDGRETWRTAEPGICAFPGYLKITTEFGSWAAPIVPEELPDFCRVDWVRVWEEIG